MGDPNYEQESQRTHNWPMLKIEILVGETRSYSTRHADVVVRMHLYTFRDYGFAGQSDINARIVTVFDGIQIGAVSPFTFSLLMYKRHFLAPSSGTELHYVHEFDVRPMV